MRKAYEVGRKIYLNVIPYVVAVYVIAQIIGVYYHKIPVESLCISGVGVVVLIVFTKIIEEPL